MESQTRLMSWYWKRKPTWRKDLITYDSHPWIMFPFNWLVIIRRGRGIRFTLDIARQGGGGPWKLANFHGSRMCNVITQSTLSHILTFTYFSWVKVCFSNFEEDSGYRWFLFEMIYLDDLLFTIPEAAGEVHFL